MVKFTLSIVQKEVLGLAFIMLPLFCYILSQLTFIIGYHLTPLVPILSIFLSALFVYRSNKRTPLCQVVLFCCIFFLCLIIATCWWDWSFDGTWYHADIQYQLAEKHYNPFFRWELADREMLAGCNSYFWSSYYPKGIETISSCWVVLTHNLESGKATNLFFIFGLFFVLDSFVSSYEIAPKGIVKYLFLFIVIGNPVVFNQMLTNYIDWTSYIFLLIAIICVLKVFLLNDRRYEFILYMLFVLVINIKINIAFWVCLFTMLLMISLVLIYKKKLSKDVNKLFFRSFFSIAIGFVLAFNPYVSNYILKGNILYPLAGEDKMDIMTANIPKEIKDDGVFVMINKSMALKTWMQAEDPSKSIVSKMLTQGYFDSRIGGFGLFFFEATIILLILSFFSKVQLKMKCFVWGCLFVLYSSLFVLPSGWWARYVAYFYLSPILLLPLCYYAGRPGVYKHLFFIAVILLVVNSGLSLITSSYLGIINQRNTERCLNYLQDIDTRGLIVQTPNALFLEKMKKRGIHYHRNNSLEEKRSLVTGGSPVYFDGVELPEYLVRRRK